MKQLLRPLAILALVAFSATADAGTIRLKNGTRIEGVATAYDGTKEVLSWRATDGKSHEIALADLDTRSAYSVLKSQVPKTEAKGQLQLANFARDVEYYAHAVRHYEYAFAADPSLKPEIDKEVEILRKNAAKWGMAKAREAAAKGDIKGAEKWLEKIILKLPNQPEAAEARRLIDEYYSKVKAEETKEVDNVVDDVVREGLAKAKKNYDSMLKRNQESLKSSKGSSSVRGWEAAIKDGEKAHKEIDKFEKRNPGKYTELLDGYRATLDKQIIEIHLNIASHLAVRSSYNQALNRVNLALAIDSRSTDALNMRGRIEVAASRGLGWF